MPGYHFKDPVLTVPATSDGWLVSQHKTGAQTATVLRTPAEGNRLYLDKLVLSTTANAVVTLQIGDFTCLQTALAANVPFVSEWKAFGKVDAPLTITTSAGDVYANVTGFEGK